MKKLNFFVFLILFTSLIAACTFYPVVPQAEFEARQTAQAQVVLPTVTSTPEIVPTLPFTPTPEIVPPTITPTVTRDCTVATNVVKGNIDAKGNKIYHLPNSGDPNYAKTIGEECFPDAASAEAAGYRPIKK